MFYTHPSLPDKRFEGIKIDDVVKFEIYYTYGIIIIIIIIIIAEEISKENV